MNEPLSALSLSIAHEWEPPNREKVLSPRQQDQRVDAYQQKPTASLVALMGLETQLITT